MEGIKNELMVVEVALVMVVVGGVEEVAAPFFILDCKKHNQESIDRYFISLF